MREDKLAVVWSKKKRDFIIRFPLGRGTKCDGHLVNNTFFEKRARPDPKALFGRTFEKSLIDDLRDRGYDAESLRFEINVDLSHPKAAERFPTLFKEAKR